MVESELPKVIEATKNLTLEAPIALDSEEGQKLLGECEDSGQIY